MEQESTEPAERTTIVQRAARRRSRKQEEKEVPRQEGMEQESTEPAEGGDKLPCSSSEGDERLFAIVLVDV